MRQLLFFVAATMLSGCSTPTSPATPTAPPAPAPTQAPTTPPNPDGLWLSEEGFYVSIEGKGQSVTLPDPFMGMKTLDVSHTKDGTLSWTQNRHLDEGSVTYTVVAATPTHLKTIEPSGDQQVERSWVKIDADAKTRSYSNESLVGVWEDGVANVTTIELRDGVAQVVKEQPFSDKGKVEIMDTGWNPEGFFFWTARTTAWDPEFVKPSLSPLTHHVIAQNKGALAVGTHGSNTDIFILTRHNTH